jgi:hypothetical protein
MRLSIAVESNARLHLAEQAVESHEVSGLDFSRAKNANRNDGALAPAGICSGHRRWRGMSDRGDGELAIVIGSVLIISSFFVTKFYGSTGFLLSNKQIPTWMGRLFCWIVGGMMILVGLNFLFPPR